MTKRMILFFFSLSIIIVAAAQDTIPRLKGQVNISVKNGTIDCHFTLSNIPRIEDYVIRINSGMNIHYFKNPAKGNLLYYELERNDSASSGESRAFYFPGPRRKGKFLPTELEMHYLGMYPVISDSSKEKSVEDWRGNVAFNGQTLRVDGYQSAWYPVLFDMKKQIIYEKVVYDLTINCSDCKTIYVNGNKPVRGQSASFKTDQPEQLTLFCGDYEYSNIGGTYVLNPGMDDAQLKEFTSLINSYKRYFEKQLGVAYNGDITFIQTSPTATDYGFLFVSYPTILNVGAGESSLKKIFDQKNGAFYRPYIAHELGHYYFGYSMRTNTVFGDVIDEGFTEFISLKLTRDIIADSIYRKKIRDKVKALKDFSAVPFARVRTKEDFNSRELYVYYYAPVILTAVEKEIGEQKMWSWLKIMLKTKVDFTDYQFLIKTLSATLKDEKQLALIKSKYFDSEQSLKNAMETIGGADSVYTKGSGK